MYRRILIALAVLLLFPGCAPIRSYIASPKVQLLESPVFDARLEPLKKDAPYYDWFRLTVKNKSGRDLTIDWSRTRYFHDGRVHGRFGFVGITPAQIKGTVPATDTVPAGAEFSKEITPLQLVAFAPIKNTGVGIVSKGIHAGQIPPGENGVFLVLEQGGNTLRTKLTVMIIAQKGD